MPERLRRRALIAGLAVASLTRPKDRPAIAAGRGGTMLNRRLLLALVARRTEDEAWKVF
jgi:hypothetical protein